jgi:thiamine-phosphate pyrophosphorylase
MPRNSGLQCLTGLCFITRADAVEATVPSILAAGVRWIQYREKDKPKREIYFDALSLRERTREAGACLIINDYVDVALAVDADGVHLGQDDLPLAQARKIMGDRIIGISTHSLSEAVEAAAAGADYIGFGPIYATATKDAGSTCGTGPLREVKERVSVPVIAIGGITVGNLEAVLDTGCDGVAVSSGLIAADSGAVARRFLASLAARRRVTEGR